MRAPVDAQIRPQVTARTPPARPEVWKQAPAAQVWLVKAARLRPRPVCRQVVPARILCQARTGA